jgi:GMP reductase
MLGGMLAGCDEGGGEIDKENNAVKFYGMSSNAAQEEHGGTKDYRASEGRVVQLPYKGPVGPVVGDILGGLRSTCTYVGAKSLKELSKRTTFVQVNNGKQYNTVFENLTTGD